MTVDSRRLLELWEPGRTASPSELDWLKALQMEFPAFALPFLLTAFHTRDAEPNTHEAAIKAAAVRIPQRDRLSDRLHLPLARPFAPIDTPPTGTTPPIQSSSERLPHPEDPMEAARRKVRLILEENRRMRDLAALKTGQTEDTSPLPSLPESKPKASAERPPQDESVVRAGGSTSFPQPAAAFPEAPPSARPSVAPKKEGREAEFPPKEGPIGQSPLYPTTEEPHTPESEPVGAKGDTEPFETEDLKLSLEEWLKRIEAEERFSGERMGSNELGRIPERSEAERERGVRDKKRKEKKKKKLDKKGRKKEAEVTLKQPDRQKVQFELINQFIEKLPELRPEKSAASEKPAPAEGLGAKNAEAGGTEGLMTETLAELYFAQKHYTLALEAYEILLLRFPEKSSFFAARISELRNRLETPRL
ncbi:hypothetical protein GC167_09750 [bacterium]|nr:hypothetical protein [bacterium]